MAVRSVVFLELPERSRTCCHTTLNKRSARGYEVLTERGSCDAHRDALTSTRIDEKYPQSIPKRGTHILPREGLISNYQHFQ
ncbi:MAG: hypothetical protein JWQ42_3930 [Edaphobacter sp.]|nr:hypothetical protein [Edaphobacter sp.]